MIDLTVEPRFASAFAGLMQAYAAGGGRIARASADQWARAWCPAQWQAWSRSPLTPWGVWATAIGTTEAASATVQPPTLSKDEPFASYRTSSGHATAQVIVLEDRRR
jgi:hypothetical protein